jgi:hypothetical protein
MRSANYYAMHKEQENASSLEYYKKNKDKLNARRALMSWTSDFPLDEIIAKINELGEIDAHVFYKQRRCTDRLQKKQIKEKAKQQTVAVIKMTISTLKQQLKQL